MTYTDTDHTGGTPLRQPWEAVAARELSDVLHYLTHGLIFGPEDFAERLRLTADQICDPDLGLITEAQRYPAFAGELANNDQVLAVIGVHAAALAYASKMLKIEIGTLLQFGKAKLENMSVEELEQICKNAILK
jgi:hypothetical protein